MSSITSRYSFRKVSLRLILIPINRFFFRLPCSFVTYALLGSYTAQAELGDHNEMDHGLTCDYLKDLQFAPMQDEELLKRIHDQHKRHKYYLRFFFRDIPRIF